MESFSRRKFIISSAAALSTISALGFQALAGNIHKNSGPPLKVGLIGCGSRGIGLAMILKDLPEFELVACCDTIPDHLKRGLAHAKGRPKGYSNYQKLLENKEVDAVFIATPLYLHYPMGMDAIDAGKHIYMEKTITHNIEEAISLANKVQNSQLIFQVGHQYRYYGLYHKVKEVIDKGWCGKVTQFECQYHQNSDWRRAVSNPKMEKAINWRMYLEFSGGIMTELAAHQIDIVNWFAGNPPEKVTGMGSLDYYQDGREISDHTRAIYRYPKGLTATVSSILTNAYKGYSLRILGTEGTIEIQRDRAFIHAEAKNVELGTVDGVSGATIKNWTQGEAVAIPFDSPDGNNLEPTYYAIMDFAKCIYENKQPFADVQKGKTTAIAVHMGNKAMEEEKFQHWQPAYTV